MKLLKENGILYSFSAQNAGDLPEYWYHWHHLPTQTKGKSRIHIRNSTELHKLIAYWNSKDSERWVYYV